MFPVSRYIYIFLFFSLLFQIGYSQQKEIERINLLLIKSDDYILKDELKSLEFSKEANVIALRIGNSQKIVETYMHISRTLLNLGMNKESLEYIERGLKANAKKKDIMLELHLRELKADNYGALGLFDQELKEYYDIIELIPKNDDIESKRFGSRINGRIAAYFFNDEEYVYANKYIDKSLKIQLELAKIDSFSELGDIYNIKGLLCLYTDKKDSAYYFIEKNCNFLNQDIYSKYVCLTSLGMYYKEINQYNKAVNYYLEALESMDKFKIKDLSYSIDISKNLSEIYGILGDKENEAIYQKRYYEDTEELYKSNKNDIQVAVNTILKDENNLKIKNSKKSWLVILLISVICLFFILFFYYRYRKTIKEKNLTLKEKENIISDKEEYTQTLEKKMKVSLQEVLEEAKKGKNTFLKQFCDLHPEFRPKLLKITPKLNANELTLLAYIYLNFSSKEIAEYTFRSYRTIQTRKYNLRKKLALQDKVDFHLWLKSLEDGDENVLL